MTKAVLLGAGAFFVLAAVLGGAFALGRAGQERSDTPTTVTPSTVAEASTTTAPAASTTEAVDVPSSAPQPTAPQPTAPRPPAPTIARPDDVTALPAGLLCQDLNDRGYSYAEAVSYWRATGRPASMDVDKNTIPCESVFPSSQVIGFWGVDPGQVDKPHLLEPGLRCADLQAAGYDVYSAFEYYYAWDLPASMDADGNGIPCESVYPNAAAAWYEY